MTGLHDSTLALSVYNAIARMGSMTYCQTLEALWAAWRPDMELSEVFGGVRYLTQRCLVSVVGDYIVATSLECGVARTVVRHPLRLTELVYGSVDANQENGVVLGC